MDLGHLNLWVSAVEASRRSRTAQEQSLRTLSGRLGQVRLSTRFSFICASIATCRSVLSSFSLRAWYGYFEFLFTRLLALLVHLHYHSRFEFVEWTFLTFLFHGGTDDTRIFVVQKESSTTQIQALKKRNSILVDIPE